jgi:hypothetical protein
MSKYSVRRVEASQQENSDRLLDNEIERLAKANKYRTLGIEPHEDKPLGSSIAPGFMMRAIPRLRK